MFDRLGSAPWLKYVGVVGLFTSLTIAASRWLGGTILIPLATAYLDLNAVQAATSAVADSTSGFLTLLTLFNHWGWFAPLAGAMWFGLFLAGLTSSLAMGRPVITVSRTNSASSASLPPWPSASPRSWSRPAGALRLETQVEDASVTTAWMMLDTTWAVIIIVTVRFYVKALRWHREHEEE